MSTGRETAEKLALLLERKMRELNAEALRRGGRVPEHKLRDVESLRRIVELARPSPRPTRWLAVTLLAVTFLITGTLLVTRVKPLEVELDLAASNVSFSLQDRRQITGMVRVDELTASGTGDGVMPLPNARLPLALQAVPQKKGSIILSALAPPPDSRIELASGPGPRFALSLKGSEIEVQATLSGTVALAWPGYGPQDGHFGQGKAVYLTARGQPLHLEGSVAPSTVFELLPHLPVRDLELVRSFDEVLDGRRSLHTASSVLSGSLYDETLNGREIRLRPYQWIELPGARGEIRSLTMSAQGIQVRFHGWANDVVLGHGPNRRSLAPSRLEWLSERHGLKLLWASALWLFGVAAGVFRWWKNPSV